MTEAFWLVVWIVALVSIVWNVRKIVQTRRNLALYRQSTELLKQARTEIAHNNIGEADRLRAEAERLVRGAA